ncbi:ATP-binding cassette domain-containing protein [Nocardioides mesophilus]|uniref:ATP-binding cassette domain-containing protein n=1 Tax=Nocardioides mesophilus TaxID=433659 RepID=A0A7G9RDW1_9ACTN|nr:ATP-binding cassette domain-containing protein [Nocardioides mesophilus]QNN53786.1 ATP-binding cassette domain-containing protein [Nocardioides mesophilus]
MAVIEARGLAKTYGGKPAVSDLSFEVHPGSVTGFLGPNGAGKSTTMRLMLGLDRGAGTTTFDGVPFTSLHHPMRHVGALLEAKPFHPTRRARNHLRMLAAANAIPVSRVDEVLEQLGLASVARGKPRTFSLGMGQRLGLAAALLGDPHTLILDEPANGLDPQGIQWIRELLKSFAASGRSVFVSSHLLSEMALMADELVVIGRGRLIASGPIGDFVKSSRHNSVLARSPQATELAEALRGRGAQVEALEPGLLSVTGLDAAAIGDVAFDASIRLHELAPRTATLEEAFLEATEASQEYHAVVAPVGDDPGAPPPAGAATDSSTTARYGEDQQ